MLFWRAGNHAERNIDTNLMRAGCRARSVEVSVQCLKLAWLHQGYRTWYRQRESMTAPLHEKAAPNPAQTWDRVAPRAHRSRWLLVENRSSSRCVLQKPGRA